MVSPDEIESAQVTNQKNILFYSDLAAKHGASLAGVGQTARSQTKRFAAILKIGDLEGRTLLDVGCGYGHLYTYLQNRRISVDYTGFDITPAMIEIARQANPEIADRFQLVDIMTEDLSGQYDYVVCNGALNVDWGNNLSVMTRMIQRMYSLCGIGMAITMTSALTKRPTRGTYYFDPAEIVRRISPLCQNFILDHSYLPHDFALFAYKRNLYD